MLMGLPPGPMPLPIIGNIPTIALNSRRHWSFIIEQMKNKYGPVFTLWMGMKPFIFVSDLNLAQKTFGRVDGQFAGRHDSYFGQILSLGEHVGMAFTDYGPAWECLRKAIFSAVQELPNSDKLSNMVSDCVDKTVEIIINEEGVSKAFNPFEYIHYLFINITSIYSFEKYYDINDEEYKKLKFLVSDFKEELGLRVVFWEFSSFFRRLDKKLVEKYEHKFKNIAELILNNFVNHYEDYDESNIRDVCDALISAKNDAIKKGKSTVPYFTDNNLANSVLNMFVAGTETPGNAFKWILLYLTHFPNIQKILRKEIEREIGDRPPTFEDRNRCHYVMAVISESIRYSGISALPTQHKARSGSKIGKFNVPDNAHVFYTMAIIGNDEMNWTNPREFTPERFLENGMYVKNLNKAYVPFGVGPRICPGEKLAYAELFMVLVRFLQKTTEYEIKLYSHQGFDADPNITATIEPQKYKIILKNKI